MPNCFFAVATASRRSMSGSELPSVSGTLTVFVMLSLGHLSTSLNSLSKDL